jgi:succinyl-CoA synthetase beta subunit
MDLLEYQAKTLFRDVGIPVLPSQRIYQPRDIKKLQVPYPVVLKSQVRVGGRAKAGGIRFVENTIDAIAATQTILTIAIAGEYPELVLAEARYATQQELYLAIVLDYHFQHPVLLGSGRGGVEVDAALDDIQTVVIEDEFSPFHARRLAIQMGLTGESIQAVGHIVEKMYDLFASKDLDSIEINPLGINAAGEVMALDGKITLSDTAIARHPQLQALLDHPDDQALHPPALIKAQPGWSSPKKGEVGLISPNPGVAAMVWDGLAKSKARPGQCWLLDPYGDLATQTTQAMQAAIDWPDFKSVVVYLPGELAPVMGAAIATLLAPPPTPSTDDRLERPTALAVSRQRRAQPVAPAPTERLKPLPKLVLYCPGGLTDLDLAALDTLPIHSVTTIDQLLAALTA